MIPTAMSTTLPFIANVLNSCIIPWQVLLFDDRLWSEESIKIYHKHSKFDLAKTAHSIALGMFSLGQFLHGEEIIFPPFHKGL